MEPQFKSLIADLDEAVRLEGTENITAGVKTALERFTRDGYALPSRFRQCCRDSYARRLLHRDPAYTVVVMTWGPGQGTELHDHAGIWCVECVADGEVQVEQFDIVEQSDDRFRFESRQRVQAVVGNAGCLIPPFEYHTLANSLQDHASVTIHVYGGDMEYCHLYQPADSGWWRRIERRLDYAS